MTGPRGRIIVLNGVPRSGKSSIARVIQDTFDGPWMNLGVDAFKGHVAPSRFGPGLGLRPHAGRPDFEGVVEPYFLALYASMAAHARQGLNVVADIGHHDAYSRPIDVLPKCAGLLRGLEAWFVGVRCSIEVVMERRNAGHPGREGVYASGTLENPIPPSILLWQDAIHEGKHYDVEVDTSSTSPDHCAKLIAKRVEAGEPVAFLRLQQGRE